MSARLTVDLEGITWGDMVSLTILAREAGILPDEEVDLDFYDDRGDLQVVGIVVPFSLAAAPESD